MKYLIMVAILFCGCVPEGEGLSRYQVQARFPHAIVADNTYEPLTRGRLSALLKSYRESRHMSLRPKWDCDDIARDFASYVCRKHADSNSGGDAPAIGEAWYATRTVDHAVNVAITPSGVVWIDVDAGSVVALDVQTVYFLRF